MITLEPVSLEMEGWIILWLNDPEICKYNSHAVFPATEPKAVDSRTVRFAVLEDNTFIGVIALQKIDWVSRSGELAILLAVSGNGYGKKAAELLCRHGFEQMNLHRIYCGTHEKNIGMQKVAEHLGMTLEGRTRQAMFKNGEYADVLHYGLLKEEFENANSRNLQREADNLPPDAVGSERSPEG